MLAYLYIVSLPERKHFNIYIVSLKKQPQCLKHTGSVFIFFFNIIVFFFFFFEKRTRVLKNRRLYINIK